jgi:diketogulonate reductase-like aldo/keto reductase
LATGVTHFDFATQYGSNYAIAEALQRYVRGGRGGLNQFLRSTEKPELLELYDDTYKQSISTTSKKEERGFGGGKQSRRKVLFLSHKLSNDEQSTDPKVVRQAVLSTIQTLGVGDYLDLVSIHSPLTDSSRRLATYQALLGLKSEGLIRGVGVCNYGLKPLQEIVDSGMPLPVINQLELSPFNLHKNVVDWCNTNGVSVSCAAWVCVL